VSTGTVSPLAADEITPHIARLVLGHFRSGDSGDWLAFPSYGEHEALDFLCSIDDGLLDRAALGFPGLVAAVRLARQRGGVDELTSIARTDGQS
jgi:hypothetical protein